MTDIVSDEARLSAVVREDWDTGRVVDLTLTAAQPLAGWRVEVEAGGTIVNLWNAEIEAQSGTRYILRAADYNSLVPAGSGVPFGLQIEGGGTFRILGADVDLAAEVAAETAVNPRPDEADAPGEGDDAPAAGSPAGPAVSLTVDAASTTEPAGSGAGLPHDSFAPGPLSTDGARIVDSTGATAAIHGISWFGFETDIFVPHGLWERNWREMMDEVKSLGFNTLRLPFSGELVASGGGNPSGIDLSLNPDLAGLDGLQILDRIVDYADTIGLRILLDYHRGTPGGGPNENGLWFGNGRTEADVIDEWRAMAERYGDKPAVIGADVINEPHLATWGDGSATDFAAAAARIGDAILSVAPDWLVVVEGVAVYDGDPYWWGGNLQGAAEHPVPLSRPDKLVYSSHDYPPSVHEQPWYTDGTPLTEVWRKNWGYLVEENIAPVLVGEWGSRLNSAEDLAWASQLSDYMSRLGTPWMWWALNPNSGDTGGLFADDWTTVRPSVETLLGSLLASTRPAVGFQDVPSTDAALFTVSLDAPAEADVVITYATTDGTATAGADYVATAGTLTFAAGEMHKTVTVPILPDTVPEGDEFFYLVLGADGSQLATGTAAIMDDGDGDPARRPAMPYVDVADAVINDETGAARFRVMLSEPTDRDITVQFDAMREGAAERDAGALRGTLVIPAGQREGFLEVPAENGGAGRFTLELTAADGAAIRTGRASAIVEGGAPGAAEVAPFAATDHTQLTIDLILKQDWGDGALFDVVLKNVSDEPISTWRLALDLPFDIAEIWSAHVLSDEGDRVTLENADWNGAIAPGEAINFGFISDEGGIVLKQLIGAADIELAVQ